MTLDRQAECPSCGAPITFKLGGARAQVCAHCRFVVARTDRGLEAQGRMADLLELPTPLQLGVGGYWGGKRFEVEGRVQMDRAGAPGAPWQEILLGFPEDGRTTWVAQAQGRWYATVAVPLPPGGVPPAGQLGPGSHVDLGPHGVWLVQEIGQRRVVSGEGSLTGVPKPSVVTWYADLSAGGARFGTIDYADDPPVLFLGRQFDPAELKLDSGVPLVGPTARTAQVECPNCGGNLPLLSQQAERVVCQYCGMQSDVCAGKLQMLAPAPKPPIAPLLPIGAEGTVQGERLIACGFVIRSCMVEGERYPWREYLLYGGDSVGYRWLMEEEGAWSLATPIETGDVADSGNVAMFRGSYYAFKQRVDATVDYVIGEFYWKVAIGERVEAAEFEGPGGKISRERSPTEVTYSFISPFNPQELGSFGVTPPAGKSMGLGGGGGDDDSLSSSATTALAVLVLIACGIGFSVMGDGCDDDGSFSGGGSYYGGK